jgi:PAS domain S-box-containing protein
LFVTQVSLARKKGTLSKSEESLFSQHDLFSTPTTNNTDQIRMTRASVNLHLPGYELFEEIHCHAKSIVYRAKQIGINSEAASRPVIIKTLSAKYPRYQDLVNFSHQYTIAKDLDLPGVINLYSLEKYDQGYALVMEDFGGVALDEYQQHLSLTDILDIGIQLADTLHALAQQRIVHKDIKPANILIHPTTKRVKLIDFSIASLLPQETLGIVTPHLLEGTLAYLAPEQTGRMNRVVDYRSDFYALGITLYELLTGKLPFETTAPITAGSAAIELIHCHLAKIAQPVAQVNETIPAIVSQIVAKLMAKNAENRYQSALGLKYDLVECLAQWQATNTISEFELGQKDISDRFTIPEKLYGRETAVQTLLDAFARVSRGQTEMMLVAGFSGIGKTVVINEIHKPIAKQQGYFIKGKYDQFNRDLPLNAFVQAFRDLVEQLLGEDDNQLASWKKQILAAVGENGQVLIDVVPSLQEIIDRQPPIPELTGVAAQQRFNLAFQKFIEVFTTAAHPLVIFLDDLQWADPASLQLIKLLMTGGGYLLLLGAYRDNEVAIAHPLMLAIEELKQTTAILNKITLAPLTFQDTNQLIADTLHCSINLAQPLTILVDHKTQGNPFFTTQFLKSLQADGEIKFNPAGYWECDISQIQALALTDNIVELMVMQVQKLSAATQEILKLAACIGYQFDLETLAIISEQSPQNITDILWLSLEAGLILPTNHTYKFFQSDGSLESEPGQALNLRYRFLHDRVQQAAYSLIPASLKQHVHLKIGRLLLASSSVDQQVNQLFEIVNHFNVAISIIQDLSEYQTLAELNFQAAQKAQASTAYTAAFNYAQISQQLLGIVGWQKQYQLTLKLHEILVETALLRGDLEIIPTLVEVILGQSKHTLDKLKAYEVIIQFYTMQKQYPQAIACGLEILQQLGVKLTSQPHRLVLIKELLKTKIALRSQSQEDLLSLAEIVIPEKLAALRIMDLLQMTAYLASPKLMVLLATVGIQITLKYGNTPWAAGFYAHYCMVLASLGKLEQSYQIGKLAMLLADRYGNLFTTAKVKVIIPWFSQPWQENLRSGISVMDEGIKAAIDSGNLAFVGISTGMSMLTRFFAGISLDEIGDRMTDLQPVMVQSKDESSQQYFDLLLQIVQQLRGKSSLAALSHEITSGANPFLSALYGFRTSVAYLLQDIPTALSFADAQLCYESAETSGMTKVHIWMFDSLTRLAAYPNSDIKVKKQLLKRVACNQKNLLIRAKLMPGNFQHKYDLIEAEKYRVLAKPLLAMEFYDRSIAGAKAHKYLQEEALGNELAAKFYLEQGKGKIAAIYLQEAYHCYTCWGAQAKIDYLEQQYPELLKPIIQAQQPIVSGLSTLATISPAFATRITNSSHGLNTFDLVAIIKSTQALSGIIELPALIDQLCRILLENSGAEICIPILSDHQNGWQVYGNDPNISVERSRVADKPFQLTYSPLATCSYLPLKLINQVRRTSQTIILNQGKDMLPDDEYFQRYQAQSVMCLPLINQGELKGIIYLENRHLTEIFSFDQQIVLELIATQAVITLQNAQLYESLTQRSIAIENSTDGIAISDDNQIAYINHSYAKMFGYTVSELSGKPWEHLHPPAQIKYFQEEVSLILAEDRQWRGESIGIRQDGSIFDVELSLSLLPNNQRVCICRDITSQKAALREEQRKEFALRAIIEGTSGKTGADFYQACTKYLAEIFEVRYTFLTRLLDDSFTKSQMISLWTGGELIEPYEMELANTPCLLTYQNSWGIFPSDLQVHFPAATALANLGGESYISVVIRDFDGNIIGNLGVIDTKPLPADISTLQFILQLFANRVATEMKRQADEDNIKNTNYHLELTNQELLHATRLKDEFLATMSHELRTPLNAIIGMSEGLQEEVFGPLNEDQLRWVAMTETSGRHLLSLINDILDVSKIAAGKLELEIIPVSLLNLCDSSIDFLKQQASSKQITIRSEILIDLAKINVDERRIRQVLINLLGNAVKFTPINGYVNLRVFFQDHDRRDASLCFEVSDTGIGITPVDQTKLFQPFIQIDSKSNRQYAGTGLGLAIVKQVVELHGGTVSLRSQVGQGSCFTIHLPPACWLIAS